VEELLFLAHRIPYPPNKGDKIRSWNILKHLTGRYRVRLGCLIDDPHDLQYVTGLERHCAEVMAVPINPRLRRFRSLLALKPGMPISAAYFHHPALSGWVRRTIDTHDVKHVFVYSSPMMASLPPGLRIPVTLDFVDVDSEKWREMSKKSAPPKNWIYAREARTLLAFERRAASAAAHALFCSRQEAALFIRRAPEAAAKTEWMLNGVDLDYFSPAHRFPDPFPLGRPAIVFTGDMSYWPNIDAVTWFVRDVLPALIGRTPRPVFAIVGANPSDAVLRLANEDVIVTGRVADIRPYLAHASAVVAPLLLARGIQNKVLEGMAMGKAVIATEAAEEGLDVAGAGALSIADDATQMSLRIAETLDGAHGDMGRLARQVVEERFAWPKTLEKLDILLDGDDALGENKPL